MTGIHVTITGLVQGVGYRAWTVREAEKRGLRGWVRNRSDGSVEAVFFGASEAVGAMVEACRTGPRAARVTGVTTATYDGAEPDGFSELPTV